MAHEIICEDFQITPTIKAAIESNLIQIQKHLPNSSMVHVYISEPSEKLFKVVYQVHLWKKDIVATGKGDELYHLLDDIRKIFVRNIVNHRKKMTDRSA